MAALVKRFDAVPSVATELLLLPLRIMVMPDVQYDLHGGLADLMGSEASKVMEVVRPGDHWRNDIVHVRGFLPSDYDLRAWKTRLVIVEGDPSMYEDAAVWAGEIAGAGGPAVLVATAAEMPGPLTWTLFDIYAGIVHNQKLDDIVTRRNDPAVKVYLAHGEGGERLLLLEQVWASLQADAEEIYRDAEAATMQLDSVIEENKPYVHESQLRELRRSAAPAEALQELTRDLTEARESLDWSRETGAALPMARAMEKVPAAVRSTNVLRAAVSAATDKLREETSRAPRVLNANFADENHIVEPNEPLRPATEYALLVDVGPRWSNIPSIVTGSDAFPDRYLPAPKAGGYRVQVTVVSDDFTPPLTSAEIFVPAGTGRSCPITEDGVQADKAGPAGILLRTPEASERRRAHARFCLYYEGNLIQSGVLSAVVAPAGTPQHPSDGNELEIDFALSGALRDLDVLGTGESGKPRVGFNVALNDDGAGGHRFILKNSGDPMPAFTTYDPKGAEQDLTDFREALLALFYERGDDFLPTKTPALGADNGKVLKQFRRDLFLLAQLGRKFFHGAFGQVRPETGEQPIAWTKKMQAALRHCAVIQIARTGPAQYVYPWALLYAHGLTGDSGKWRYCDVIDEEWPNGRRSGPPADSCPHQKVPGDHDNTICPYGFWGLRHIVEQPLAVGRTENGQFRLQNAATEIRSTGPVRLAIATTTDAALDAGAIAAHLARLGNWPGVQIVPEVAHDASGALNVMQETELVYLLCHGEFDQVEKKAYIGIGPKGANRDYRIYTTTFNEWALRESPPNLDAWSAHRPLVMINGCHTSDLQPGDVLNFVSALSMVNAGGVVGTEVSVRLPVALEVAQSLYEKLLPANGKPGMQIGEAMRLVRWELANKGNLLGLAYTTYCLSNLQIVSDSSPAH